MNEPTHEIEAYLSGEPTEQDLRAVEAWLHADPANARALMEQVHFREMVGERLRERSNDATHVLAELAQFEASAKTVTLPLDEPDSKELASMEDDPGALSAHDFIAAGSYLIRHSLYTRAAALTGIAALVLIGLIVFGPWGSGPTDTTTPDAADIAQDKPVYVATLTDQRGAVWRSSLGQVLQTGDVLAVGQRLTLTRGFAEITTRRGAVAVIQAPATVELIDSDNAIRLHEGKLVGQCFTESSKGFVVKTDHADVTDLGTEFGVEVKGDSVTATVFTGEIELTPPGGKPQPLTTNQTARLIVDGNNRELVVEDQVADGFDRLAPRQALIRSLRSDPAMIAYWGFEAEDIVDGKLINRAAATLGKMDGTLGQPGKPDSAPTLTEGRLPGTNALRFEAEEFDLVRVPAEDAEALNGLEQLTIALWVRPDRMDQASHHLVTKRTGDQCVLNLAMGWDADRGAKPNSLLFNSDLAGLTFKEHATEKDTLVRSGAWTHIAVTFDRGERRYYVNGELIGTKPRAGAGKTLTLDAELAIGAQHANALAQATNLDGDLDELFILGRVMPDDEITTLYETGVAQP